jgi:serine O-acetyltransferase
LSNFQDFRQTLFIDLFGKRPPRWPWLSIITMLWRNEMQRGCVFYFRLGQYAKLNGWNWVARQLRRRVEARYGCYLHHKAKIGPGLRLKHSIGVVIGEGVVIGKNATIYQHVTLGGARPGDQLADNYPKIGDDIWISAGAVAVGGITIGDRVMIGANAVVIKDVPSDHTAVGVPAQIRPRRKSSEASLSE